MKYIQNGIKEYGRHAHLRKWSREGGTPIDSVAAFTGGRGAGDE